MSNGTCECGHSPERWENVEVWCEDCDDYHDGIMCPVCHRSYNVTANIEPPGFDRDKWMRGQEEDSHE